MCWVVNAISRPLYPRDYIVFQFLYMSMRFFPGLIFFLFPKFLLLNLHLAYFYFSPTHVTPEHNFSTETLVFLSASLRWAFSSY